MILIWGVRGTALCLAPFVGSETEDSLGRFIELKLRNELVRWNGWRVCLGKGGGLSFCPLLTDSTRHRCFWFVVSWRKLKYLSVVLYRNFLGLTIVRVWTCWTSYSRAQASQSWGHPGDFFPVSFIVLGFESYLVRRGEGNGIVTFSNLSERLPTFLGTKTAQQSLGPLLWSVKTKDIV